MNHQSLHSEHDSNTPEPLRELYAQLQAARGRAGEYSTMADVSVLPIYSPNTPDELRQATYNLVRYVVTCDEPALEGFDQKTGQLQQWGIFDRRIPAEQDYLRLAGITDGMLVTRNGTPGQCEAARMVLWLVDPTKPGGVPYLSPRVEMTVSWRSLLSPRPIVKTLTRMIDGNGTLKDTPDGYVVMVATDEMKRGRRESR